MHSQEMSEDIMRQHINLYVNNYSIVLGDDGKKAVDAFINVFEKINNTIITRNNIFIPS